MKADTFTTFDSSRSVDNDNINNDMCQYQPKEKSKYPERIEYAGPTTNGTTTITTKGNGDQSLRRRDSSGCGQKQFMDNDALVPPGTASTTATTGTRSISALRSSTGEDGGGSSSFDSSGCGRSSQSAPGSSGDGDYYGDTEVNSDDNEGDETNSSGSRVEEGFGHTDNEQRDIKVEQLFIIGEKASHLEDPSHRTQQSRQSQEQKLHAQQPISQPQQHESIPQESHHQEQSSESMPSISRPLTPRFPQQQPQTPRTAPSRFTLSKAKSFKVRRAPPRSPSHFLTRSHSFGPRPSSAPAAPLSSDPSSKYTAPSHSLRSARYIANQWRSRAVQWGTASKINDGKSARLSTVLPDLPATTSGRTIGNKSPSTGSITDSDGEERQERLERLDVAKQVAKVWKERMDHLIRTDTVSRDRLPDGENSEHAGLTGSFTEESTEGSASSQKGSTEEPESVKSGLTNHSTKTRKTRGGAQTKPELSRITDSFVLKHPASISSDSESDSSVSSHNSNDDSRVSNLLFTQTSYSLESAYPLEPIMSGVETSEPSRQDSTSTCPSLSSEIREEVMDHDEICMVNTWPVLEPLQEIPSAKKKKKNVSFDSSSLNYEQSDLPQRSNNVPPFTISSDPQSTNVLDNGLKTEEITATTTLQTTVATTEETRLKNGEAKTSRFVTERAEGFSHTDTTSDEMEQLKVEISEAADKDQEGEREAANIKASADKRMRDARLAKEKEAEHLKVEEPTRMESEKEAEIAVEKQAEMKHIQAEKDAKITADEEPKAKSFTEETEKILMEEVARLKTEEEGMETEKEAKDQVAVEEAACVKAEKDEAACVKRAEEDASIAAEEEVKINKEFRMTGGEAKIFEEEEGKALASTEEAARENAKDSEAVVRSEKEAAQEQGKEDEIMQAGKKAEMQTTRLLNVKERQIMFEVEKEMVDSEVSAMEIERMRVLDEAGANVEEKNASRVLENPEKMNFAASDVKFSKIENKLDTLRPQAKAKTSFSQITKEYGCNNSITSSSMNMSLRSFLSESTGALPMSRCDSDNSSVDPEEHCNSDLDLFSLQEEKVINVVAPRRKRSLKHSDYHYDAATSTKDGVTSLPQRTLITAEETQTTFPVRNIAPMISVRRNLRTSQKSLSSSIQCLPQSSSAAIDPLSTQHATVPISTTINSKRPHSRPNFGRKRYGDANISFTFSVITSSIRAPQPGTYVLPKLGEEYNKQNKQQKSSEVSERIRHTTSGILHKILDRFSIAVRQTRMAGGILMEADCSAFPLSVKCDDVYSPPTKRPGLVRNLVRAAIPIIYVKGDTDGLRSARDSIRFTLRKSILRGDFKGVR